MSLYKKTITLKIGFKKELLQECRAFEHTAHLAYLIRRAKKQQRSLTITLLDLRNDLAKSS